MNNKTDDSDKETREQLASRKMMEYLCRAASCIEESKEWSDKLENSDWYQEQLGFDIAAHGICLQLMNAYTSLCEAHGMPIPKDQED